MAGLLAAGLLAEGVLAPEDPIRRWVPELDGVRVLLDRAGPLEETEPLARPVTVHDLLTMTSGLGIRFDDTPLARAMGEAGVHPGPVPPTLEAEPFLARLGELPLAFQPGAGWAYHTSTDVLSVVLARASGVPLDRLLAERLTGPLDAPSLSFSTPDPAAPGTAPTSTRARAGSRSSRDGPADPAMLTLSCGLWGTATDTARVLGELVRPTVLPADAVEAVRTPALTAAQLEGGPAVRPRGVLVRAPGLRRDGRRPAGTPGRDPPGGAVARGRSASPTPPPTAPSCSSRTAASTGRSGRPPSTPPSPTSGPTSGAADCRVARMLRVGLTGGIGSGKSTVSARLAALGAFVVDADAVAREVVEPGTPALAAVVERFGPEVVAADGTLDRPALGRLVFGDRAALADLEAITHPAIWARTAEIVAGARPDAVVVHDMPLVVEKAMGAQYHLVVVVGAGGGGAAATPRRAAGDAGGGRPCPDRGAGRPTRSDGPPPTSGSTTRRRPTRCAPPCMRLWSERLEPFEAQRAARHPVPPLAPDDVGAGPHAGRRRPRGCSPGCGTPWATRP